jgi:hypothetical protein
LLTLCASPQVFRFPTILACNYQSIVDLCKIGAVVDIVMEELRLERRDWKAWGLEDYAQLQG